MAYTLNVPIPANPATGATDGQTVNVYKASRFTPPDTAPATNTAPPGGGADYTGTTTGYSVNNVGAGLAQFAVTTFEDFMVAYYDPADTSNGGSYNLYWL